jgi:hypothetical protein
LYDLPLIASGPGPPTTGPAWQHSDSLCVERLPREPGCEKINLGALHRMKSSKIDDFQNKKIHNKHFKILYLYSHICFYITVT